MHWDIACATKVGALSEARLRLQPLHADPRRLGEDGCRNFREALVGNPHASGAELPGPLASV